MVGVLEAAGVTLVLGMPDLVRHVLQQRATEGHVHHLHPAADPQDRKVDLECPANERDLGVVALWHGALLGLIVRLGAVGRGVDVDAAGKDQRVEPREHLVGFLDQLRIRRDHQREPAGALDRRQVVVR